MASITSPQLRLQFGRIENEYRGRNYPAAAGKLMRRLAVISAVLLVFAGAVLAGLYLLLSPSYLTAEMAQSVARMTGKQLVFSASPRLTIWPEPGVIFNGVKLSDAGGSNETAIASIEKMRITIGAAALIGRRVEIEEIRLYNPTLHLVIDKFGRSNWNMATHGKGGKAQGQTNAFDLPPIYVEGGTVRLDDQRSAQSFSFRRLDMVVSLTSIDGPVDIKGSADWRSDRVSFSLFVRSPQQLVSKGSPVDLNVSGSWLNFAFSGRGAAEKEFDLAGIVEGSSRSLRGLMGWAGVDIGEGRGLGAFHTKGALSVKGNRLSITKGHFLLDGMRAQGEASVDFAEKKPKLNAKLSIDQLDLSQYPMPGAGSSSARKAVAGVESWSTAPIDFAALRAIDAKAALSAERLTYGGATMANAHIDATIDNGVLNAKLQQIELYGGSGRGQLVLNGAQKVPTAQIAFDAEGIDSFSLFKDFWNFQRIGGTAQVAIALAATGRNESEMIASLRGTAGLSFANGTLRGINLAEMAENVAQKIVIGWQWNAGATSDFDLLKASFKISDGIAESKDLELRGPRLALRGNGLVDLLKGEVDFKIEADASNDERGRPIIVPVVVSGPWAKPKFYPDIAGVLENPTAAYEALKTLLGRATFGTFDDRSSTKGENAGGVPGEMLSDSAGQGTATQAVDLIKKDLNTNTLELMNGFAGEPPPEPLTSEQ
jgi:AsmA protein